METITGVEDTEPEEQPEPEVHISSAEWKPGPDGFHYNKQCFLDVKAEYLKLKDNRKTIRARITGKLFGTFNDEEVDMAHTVEGFLSRDTGIARLNIKLLWFVNSDHYYAWQKDKSVLAKYVIKNISHSRGENVIDVGPELEMPVIPEDRWIIFEETAELIDPVFTYEMSKVQAPKNRWIYVFGSEDCSKFVRVWEIRTDGSGKKFATFEIDDINFDSRPELDQWEDVALLPNQNADGAPMHFVACISDIRFTKGRIFNNEHGLLLNPQCRSSDIDDPKQAIRKILPNDKEKIVLLNTLLHAEMLRKQFDDRYLKWEQIRSASWLEVKDENKKEKLIYEFGALIIRIIQAYPEYRKHLGPAVYQQARTEVHQTHMLSEQRLD